MMEKRTIIASIEYIAACGLYCGACRKYLNGKCLGCRQNDKATWCKIRQCCQKKAFRSCAECSTDVKDCKAHNNMIGKVFAFLFNSDRAACIHYIQANGNEAFAEEMARQRMQTIKKRK